MISTVASNSKAMFYQGGGKMFGCLPVSKNNFSVVVVTNTQEVDHFHGIDEGETNKNSK